VKICWDNLENVHISEKGNFRKDNRTYYLNICEECGEECLSVKRKDSLDKTCSIECSKSEERNPFFGKTHSRKQKKKWSKERKGTNIGKDNSFYGKKHSEETKEKLRGPREWMRGENHPRWNPSKKIRERRELEEWRLSIFERDDYTCQNCNIRGTILAAHHLEAYNRSRHLRTDIDNGITLCQNCHVDFHKMFGFGSNTRKQFLEFVGESNV